MSHPAAPSTARPASPSPVAPVARPATGTEAASVVTALCLPLPPDSDAIADASWPDLVGYYDALEAWPLDRTTLETWLRTWSRLEELLSEANALAATRYCLDTTDAALEAAHLRWSGAIMPAAEAAATRLIHRYLAVGVVPAGMEVATAQMAEDVAIFRDANVARFGEEAELSARYQHLAGGLTVDWDGEAMTLPQLAPKLADPDRGVRERAFRAIAAATWAARDILATLFTDLYALRQRIASEAGFGSYRDYCWTTYHRTAYTPADCLALHAAIEAVVVPAVGRQLARRQARLGVDRLRPWDLDVNPTGAAAIRAFEDESECLETAQRVFDAVEPSLGDEFRMLRGQALLDVMNRPGKSPGGFCTTYDAQGVPFIFMNAVGTPDDVNTLVHEAGHAFHACATRTLPYVWQRHPGMEAAELASMAMELLARPMLAAPLGYYTPAAAREAERAHLEDILTFLPYCASVDAFQHWIYTDPEGADAEARDRMWCRIRARFEPVVAWDGLTMERTARWYRQLHLFEHPFYYIEYAIAQLGALQLWQQAEQDREATLARYRDALALGNTASLDAIFRAAGVELVFDRARLQAIIDAVEHRLLALEATED